MIFGKKIHVSDGDSDYRDQILDDIQSTIDVAHDEFKGAVGSRAEEYKVLFLWNILHVG